MDLNFSSILDDLSLPEIPSGTYRDSHLSEIDLSTVASPGNFSVEDHQLHRSVPDVPSVAHFVGGVGAVPPPMPFVSSHYSGAHYSPTELGSNMWASTSLPKDSSLASDDAIKVQELIPPFFLETNTHIFLSRSATIPAITTLVEDVLRSFVTDFVFKPEKCKWKVQRCQQLRLVQFRVQVQSCDGELVVEFQKRKGEFFLMKDIFDSFQQAAQKQKLVKETFTPRVQPTFPLFTSRSSGPTSGKTTSLSPPPFPAFGGQFLPVPSLGPIRDPLHNEDDQEVPLSNVVNPLVAQAKSDCSLTAYESVLSMAKLSASEDNRASLKDAGVIPVLVKLLVKASRNTLCGSELKQAVAAALSNLSESASCKPSIIASGALSALLDLVSNPQDLSHKYLEMETRRESARALANLAEEYSSAIVEQIGKEAVSQWMQSVDAIHDDRLRMHARRIKNRVRYCC